jgi:hypothetical protein
MEHFNKLADIEDGCGEPKPFMLKPQQAHFNINL